METEILHKAREYMIEGKLEKVQIILRRALDENPNNPKVLELCGDLAIKLGRDDEAIQRYEHASENYTHNNQYAEAIVCLEKILKVDRSNEAIFSKLADLYRFYGLPNEAIKKIFDLCIWTIENKDDVLFISGLRKIVEMQPKNLSLRLSFAKLLIAINRTQEAQDELKKLRSQSEEAGNDTIISEIRKLSPQHDGGEELDPKSRVELGNLLYEIGSKDEAIVEFNRAASDLIADNKIDEAITILNRIVEIDPGNTEALNRIKELKGEPAPEATPDILPEITPVIVPEYTADMYREAQAKKPGVTEPPESPPIQGDFDILQELSKEVAGFSMATEAQPAEEILAEEPKSPKPPVEDTPTLEGQIADIEFLLKEAELPPLPSFELAQQFDEFRSNIIWESEDIKKKTDLAKIAFAADLYEAALGYIKDDKNNKEVWPVSLEIIGSSLVKLGRYSDAIKTIGPMILLEDIPEKQKVELRYILASAYEGLGDFENALREIEHIIAINPNYRDVKEIYQLLGGKMKFEEPAPVVMVQPPTQPQPVMQELVMPPFEEKVYVHKEAPEITVKPYEETFPIVIESELSAEQPVKRTIEETPERRPVEDMPIKKPSDEISEMEEKSENITFL